MKYISIKIEPKGRMPPRATMTQGSMNHFFSGIGRGTALILHQCCPPPCRGLFRGVAMPAAVCHKEPARVSKAPYKGLCFSLVLYDGIRAPIIWLFHAWKHIILMPARSKQNNPHLWVNTIHSKAPRRRRAGSLWHKIEALDQWEPSLFEPRPMRVENTVLQG